ncbi:MAG: MFS transporter [Pyrobaculum sp.]
MRPIFTLLGVVAIHMLGFGIVIPVMPYVVKELGGGSEAYGVLVSIFSAVQMVSAPLWGALSDRIGRGPVITLGLALAAIGSAMAYGARSLAELALARAVSGMGGGTLGAVQALIADLSPPERRASNMALFGVAFGIGFILGPVVGGLLSVWGVRTPFIAAVIFSAAAAALSTSLPRVRGRVGFSISLQFGAVAGLVLALNLAFSMFESMLVYYAADVFKMAPSDLGVLMLIIGLAVASAQPAVRRLEGRVTYATSALAGFVATGAGIGVLPALGKLGLYLGSAVAAVGQMVASSSLFALFSQGERGRGIGFGALQSTASLGRIIGPSLAGWIYLKLGPSYVFYAAALLLLAASPAFWFWRR